MDKKIQQILTQYDQRVERLRILYIYQLSELCIKADPMALIAVSVSHENEKLNIEDTSSVTVTQWNQFHLVPKDEEYIQDIAMGVKAVRPELKQEFIRLKKDEDSDDTIITLLLTTPPVDEDRRNLLLKLTSALHDSILARIKIQYGKTTAKIAMAMMDASNDDRKEILDILDKNNDDANKEIDGIKEKKDKEIEEAYKAYLKEKAESKLKQQEDEEAHNPEAAFSMRVKNLE